MPGKGHDLDELHGDTVVAQIVISCMRSGTMTVKGDITDEAYARAMLDTARDVLTNYHLQQRSGNRSPILVPAHDTALRGTPQEQALLRARDELANARDGR